MAIKNLIGIGQISLTVAWMLSSAGIWIFKDSKNALWFMFWGFIGIVLLRIIEHYLYIDELKEQARYS